MKIFISILLGANLLLPYAAHTADHEHEHHEAHVHGEAQLFIALDGTALTIELHSPAMNLVGFEHQPQTAEQKQAIKDTVALLQTPNQLFDLPANANCVSKTVQIEAPYAHDSNAPHKHGDEQTHTEFSAHYHFNCQNMALLQQMRVHLMQHFAGIKEIEAQTVSSTSQRQQTLSATANRIDVR